MTEHEKVMSGLEPMFKQAREEGLWFYCGFEDLWFSPDELEKEQANGRFLWGACNWRLRDPHEHLVELKKTAVYANKAILDFESHLN